MMGKLAFFKDASVLIWLLDDSLFDLAFYMYVDDWKR